jgi:hypothetical protein
MMTGIDVMARHLRVAKSTVWAAKAVWQAWRGLYRRRDRENVAPGAAKCRAGTPRHRLEMGFRVVPLAPTA